MAIRRIIIPGAVFTSDPLNLPLPLPGVPTNVAATGGAGQVAVSWSAPAGGAAGITDWIVQYRPSGGSWTTAFDGVQATPLSATITGLSAGEHEVRVAAVNATGTGAFSAAVAVTVAEPPLDPILVPGSLLLIDPSHPQMSWASGVPAAGASIPNLAWKEAAAALGSGDATSLAGTVASAFVAADGTLERTAKGGLHHIVSKTTDTAAHLYSLQMAAALCSYLATNLGHATYLGATIRVTRAGAAGSVQNMVRLAKSGSIVRQAIQELADGTQITGSPTSGTTFLGRTNFTTPGIGVAATAISGHTTADSILPTITYAGPASATYLHKAPSWILYDLYVEDLTVSGRTYAQALAAHEARKTALHDTPGGRYYGDTFTDPATVA